MGRLVEHGWDYQAAKAHMGKWYKVPVGIGAGRDGRSATGASPRTSSLTIFQARLVAVPKPHWHLWKFFATGAAALTVGTVQGVIQVQPANADWLYKAGPRGRVDRPDQPRAHQPRHRADDARRGRALRARRARPAASRPRAALVNRCFCALLGGSLAFYGVCLYLGFHEGGLVVDRGLTPEQAEEATPLHPFLIMGAGIAMFAAFWLLLAVIVRSFWRSRGPLRPFVLAGCAALAVGTLQGPVQAFPAVNELLDRGGDAGDVIVNLHAQLNMLGGPDGAPDRARRSPPLRSAGAELAAAPRAVRRRRGRRRCRRLLRGRRRVLGRSRPHRVAAGASFAAAVAALEPWEALVLVPAALVVLAGFCAVLAACRLAMTARQRDAGRRALAALPRRYTGTIPRRVRRRSPAALAGYELPMGLMGFPGVGWLFAGFPFTASILLMAGPALAWAIIPVAFSPYGEGPLRADRLEGRARWLPARRCSPRGRSIARTPAAGACSTARRPAVTAARPEAAYTRRDPRPLQAGRRSRPASSPSSSSRCRSSRRSPASARHSSLQLPARFTTEVTGQFLADAERACRRSSPGAIPRSPYPHDALQVRGAGCPRFVVRAVGR